MQKSQTRSAPIPSRLDIARRIGLRRVHRVDIPLQRPFDHETGQLYDPDNHKKAD